MRLRNLENVIEIYQQSQQMQTRAALSTAKWQHKGGVESWHVCFFTNDVRDSEHRRGRLEALGPP